ncbi:hypothetical protein G3I15_00015, partial [Streptomyces sp. SID10244]|nr:hypothetical protein [Streptomyces sp. SID10244]
MTEWKMENVRVKHSGDGKIAGEITAEYVQKDLRSSMVGRLTEPVVADIVQGVLGQLRMDLPRLVRNLEGKRWQHAAQVSRRPGIRHPLGWISDEDVRDAVEEQLLVR